MAPRRYIVDQLYRAALKAGVSHVRIDFKHAIIEPAQVRTPTLVESVRRYQQRLGPHVQGQGAALDMVESVWMDLRFDFDRVGRDLRISERALPIFDCTVELVDDRGRVHQATVRERWRQS